VQRINRAGETAAVQKAREASSVTLRLAGARRMRRANRARQASPYESESKLSHSKFPFGPLWVGGNGLNR